MEAYFLTTGAFPGLFSVAGAGERTVTTTSSYEARVYGVKTGMTTSGRRDRPLSLSRGNWAFVGEHLKAMGKGKLDQPIEVVPQDPKSIGRSTTLPQDLWKRDGDAASLSEEHGAMVTGVR